MPTFITPFFRDLFISVLCLFTINACGVDENSPAGRSNNTGSYAPSLIFPADIPRSGTVANALSGIDCNETGISVLRFAFYDAADTLFVDDQFPCSDHQATVAGIPTGNNRRVVVTAESQSGEVLLSGEERNITIRKNRTTEGGDITMTPVSPSSFTNNFGMTFNLIPAGTFMMGSPETELGRHNNEIQHQVTLTQDYYMQTTEVTQGQWRAVMGQNPSHFQNCGENCPVENVSWDDVQEFLRRLNAQLKDEYEYRLPTEAQWEYAARAGSNTSFYGGDITEPNGNDPILNTLGWYYENSDTGYSGCSERDGRCMGPQPVGGKSANDWGLFDMYGNVYEWCSDWYGGYPTGSVTDPLGPSSGDKRVLRGGGWINEARICRSASRGGYEPGDRDNGGGFRLTASIPVSPSSFTNDFGMTFNLIPAGTFMMGSPETELGRHDDEIQHQVTLTQDYYMQTTEVTQGQWRAVMGQNPSYFQNCGDNCPVESVSWNDIQEFLRRLNAQIEDEYEYRLPTEAQWEYAARAGSDSAFCEGDITEPSGNDPILNTLGWYDENSDAGYSGCSERDGRCIGPQPVGGKSANDWGLFDMHGNVGEWCSDWYSDYPSDSVTDPLGPTSGDGRVLRSGCWYSVAVDCRSAIRFWEDPGYRNSDGGFRLAASLFSR
jgi:formylglycine-generating enzyme required for sulfatase activity